MQPVTRALVPGTFDPPTLGHLDVILRAAALFDEVVVAVLDNTAKTPWFSAEERESLLRAALDGAAPGGLANVRVDRFTGLLVQFADAVEARVVVKGLRSGADFDYERSMAHMNRELAPRIETVFIPADPRFSHLSSSLVREVALFGGDVARAVPPPVLEPLKERAVEQKRGRHHPHP
jgi:pantetheine-phosphate adenylyltransferase